MQTASRSFVLDPQEFRLLEGLRLTPRKTFSGKIRGERLTRRKGISIEFADYRDYTDGDDLRHMDWNVLARLEMPVIKTYQDEEDLAVYVMLDCSTSMEFGEPNKFEIARRLACTLGYIALCGLDAAYPRTLGSREPPLPALRGRSSYLRLANWALAKEPTGTRGLAASLREFAAGGDRPGLVLLISDCLDPEIGQAIRILGGRGHEVDVVQVLSPEEIDPDLEGDLRLLDAENPNAMVEITANSLALRAYKENLEKHCKKIEAEALRVGGRYERFLATDTLDSLLKRLKRTGWVAS